MIDQKKNFGDFDAKKSKMGPKSQLFASGDHFSSQNLTSMAPAGKLIIDQKSILKTFLFL